MSSPNSRYRVGPLPEGSSVHSTQLTTFRLRERRWGFGAFWRGVERWGVMAVSGDSRLVNHKVSSQDRLALCTCPMEIDGWRGTRKGASLPQSPSLKAKCPRHPPPRASTFLNPRKEHRDWDMVIYTPSSLEGENWQPYPLPWHVHRPCRGGVSTPKTHTPQRSSAREVTQLWRGPPFILQVIFPPSARCVCMNEE